MNKEEAIAKLIKCQHSDEIPEAHQRADEVLCDLLKELGYGDVVVEYHKVHKWFE